MYRQEFNYDKFENVVVSRNHVKLNKRCRHFEFFESCRVCIWQCHVKIINKFISSFLSNEKIVTRFESIALQTTNYLYVTNYARYLQIVSDADGYFIRQCKFDSCNFWIPPSKINLIKNSSSYSYYFKINGNVYCHENFKKCLEAIRKMCEDEMTAFGAFEDFIIPDLCELVWQYYID